MKEKLKMESRWLVEWNHDEFWYPATVIATDDARSASVYVRFDDGDKQWCTPEQLLPIDIEVGDRVHARWDDGDGEGEDEHGPEYFIAHVTAIKGDRYSLKYDDGSLGSAKIDMLRVTR